ncbi:alanine racemase [Microbacterium sp. NPDC058342]|uniref:alanine racemase n=1 Tax=Microbacterium sp. NPDC058342 TaxID=3346454 RepID=UPI00366211A8
MSDPNHATQNVFDGAVQFPVLVLKHDALTNNLAEMRDFCADNDVTLAPHCKTHLSPELWQMQQEYGAELATVATVAQAAAFFDHGVRRILIANEVVDRAGLRAMSEMRRSDPGFQITMLVDSVEAITLIERILEEVAADLPPLPVLVELGARGLRSGARTVDEVIEVATAASATRVLDLIGVEGYEGVFGKLSGTERDDAINDYLDSGVVAVRELIDRGLVVAPAIATFGGSRFYPAVVERVRGALSPSEATVVLRSGCYLAHDHGSYAASHGDVPSRVGKPRLTPAMEVWGVVLSLPEPGLAIAGVGKRDVSHDEGMPVPLAIRREGVVSELTGLSVTRLNDQHALIRMSPDAVPVRVGDLMAFGISHPCTTLDKWRTAYIVDDDYGIESVVHTLFH